MRITILCSSPDHPVNASLTAWRDRQCGKHTVNVAYSTDQLRSGEIWCQEFIGFSGHGLYDEINSRLFDTTLRLMDFAVANADRIEPTALPVRGPSYYRKRDPADSHLDPHRTITKQFDLMRVADPERYPCFFDYHGHRHTLQLRKADT